MADRATWVKRVAEWRASGRSAEAFSRGWDYAPTTLRWWSSMLGREERDRAVRATPVVRMARVVRTPSPSAAAGAVLVELAGARVIVPSGADAETVRVVVEALRGHEEQ